MEPLRRPPMYGWMRDSFEGISTGNCPKEEDGLEIETETNLLNRWSSKAFKKSKTLTSANCHSCALDEMAMEERSTRIDSCTVMGRKFSRCS